MEIRNFCFPTVVCSPPNHVVNAWPVVRCRIQTSVRVASPYPCYLLTFAFVFFFRRKWRKCCTPPSNRCRRPNRWIPIRSRDTTPNSTRSFSAFATKNSLKSTRSTQVSNCIYDLVWRLVYFRSNVLNARWQLPMHFITFSHPCCARWSRMHVSVFNQQCSKVPTGQLYTFCVMLYTIFPLFLLVAWTFISIYLTRYSVA